MRRITILTALLPCIAPAPTAAQTVPSPYRFIEPRQDLGIVGGWVATDRGPANLGPKSGFAGGVQYTFRISDPLALSARVVYFPTERELVDTVTVDSVLRTASEGRADFDLLSIAVRLQFTLTGARTWHGIAPQLFAGVGFAVETSSEPDQPTIGTTSRYRFRRGLMGQFGVGASIFLSERWALRLSLLDSLWEISTPSALRNAALDPVPADGELTHNLELTAGVTRYF